ncbi:MAG: hypothetical protein ACI8P0_005837 [Planctomycetaceae bacterium]|jgi:hypothetical protein
MDDPGLRQIELATLKKIANQFFTALNELNGHHGMFATFPAAIPNHAESIWRTN